MRRGPWWGYWEALSAISLMTSEAHRSRANPAECSLHVRGHNQWPGEGNWEDLGLLFVVLSHESHPLLAACMLPMHHSVEWGVPVPENLLNCTRMPYGDHLPILYSEWSRGNGDAAEKAQVLIDIWRRMGSYCEWVLVWWKVVHCNYVSQYHLWEIDSLPWHHMAERGNCRYVCFGDMESLEERLEFQELLKFCHHGK